MAYQPPPNTEATLFGEAIVAQRKDVFNLRPMYGVSRLRDQVTTSGGGETVDESNGLIEIVTAAAAGEFAILRTLERGVYLSGTTAEIGIGVDALEVPVGDQYAEWGYFDGDNGMGFRKKSDGLYVFRTVDGVDTHEVPRSGWNIDKLDGTGPSGISFDFDTHGAIYQITFTWYGFGDIVFYVYALNSETGKRERAPLHRITTNGDTILRDPNLPVWAAVYNVTASDSYTLRIGGRQFSVLGDGFASQNRALFADLPDYTITAAEDVWEPLIAIRKKATFRGRQNSLRIVPKGVILSADDDAGVRITFDATTVGAVWGAPSGIPAGETGVELAGPGFTVSDAGITIVEQSTAQSAGGRSSAPPPVAPERETVLGDDTEVVVWVRRRTGNVTVVNVTVEWDERW